MRPSRRVSRIVYRRGAGAARRADAQVRVAARKPLLPAAALRYAARMDIRQLSYLVALGRERHFTRAAEACRVTQPTLSGRIRQLEQELGVQIVERGQRFHGFTPEGARVLAWAQRILADCDSLEAELAQLRGGLGGAVTLAAIPSALPVTPALTDLARRALPEARFTILSRTSRQIIREIEEFSIDLGLTYLDNEAVPHCLTRPLYRERQKLFLRRGHPLFGARAARWAEAAAHPLGLLTPDMQNRRIVDAAFAEAGAAPAPEIETNSMLTLCACLRESGLATILPEFFTDMFRADPDIRALPLVEPEISHVVGLAALARDPLPRLIAGVLEAAADFAIPDALRA
jgi:DNA-binding transcriptional LysR family regulator